MIGRGTRRLGERFFDCAHTYNLNWFAPQTAQPASDGVTDVAFTVRVTSDQPITVGHDFHRQDFVSVPCALMPK